MLTDAKIASIRPPATGQAEYPDHKVTGLRLRVGTGGKKSWTVRRRVGAKIINRKLGTYPALGLAAAREAAIKLIGALERHGSTESIDRTFGEVAKLWLAAKRAGKTKARGRNKSVDLQERRLDLYVLPHWQDRKIAEIKRADVRALVEPIEGLVTPNRVLTLIKTIFRWALSKDMIEASPAESIDKPNAEAPRQRVLTMDEIARVWAAAGLLGYPTGHWARVLLLTGQRRSEVAEMRWRDLDLKAGTWTLAAGDTKSERAHMVPLCPAVVATLESMPRLGDYCFTTTGDAPIGSFAQAKVRLDKWMASRGEAIEPWRFHDLRRSAATHMVRLGISETTVGRVLNHAAKGVTAQVYALHSYAPEKRHALEAWAAEVDRAVNGAGSENVVVLRQ